MRLLCEMQNFLFSWIGAAALGGFFGENVLAFVPAVISGAAGIYAITLRVDADNKADLTIRPGQVVHIKAGIAAALGGAPSSVLLTDLDPIAVELSRLGAERSGVAGVCECAVRDWSELAAWPAAAFDVCIAADVVYEPEACAAIGTLLAHTLKAGGVFLLADGKGRRNRDQLWEALLENGAFEKQGDALWVEVDEDTGRRDEPRGTLDRRIREETAGKSQAVVLQRFVRTDA